MKVLIQTYGDRNAGIQPYDVTVDLGHMEFLYDKENREDTRQSLKMFFQALLDDGVKVWFEDETDEPLVEIDAYS